MTTPLKSHRNSQGDGPDATTVYRLTFGKYKGQPIGEVPEGALRHYLGWDALYAEVRQHIEAELARRANGNRSSPDQAAVVSDPAMLAFDLVGAGEASLLAQHPGREGPIRETGQLLRDWIRAAQDQDLREADDALF